MRRKTSKKTNLSIESLRVARGWLNAKNRDRKITRRKEHGREVFHVPSERFHVVLYTVFVDEDGAWLCTCEDFRSRRTPCKHVVEVLYRFFPKLAPPVDDRVANIFGDKEWYKGARRFPHTPYPYADGLAESTRRDHALEEMDDRVESQLVDLASVINERTSGARPAYRPPLPPGDQVVVRVIRNLHRKSIRKVKPILKRMAAEGKIKFAPGRGTIIKNDKSRELIEYSREVFMLTIAPFVAIEEEVIIDSSGYSPFFVSCWSASDYGRKNIRAGTKWFKVHIVIGRLSKAILGFMVTPHEGPESFDGVQYGPLLKKLHDAGFRPRYVIADNLYLTSENILAARALGYQLVGPLKPRNFRRDGSVTDAVKEIHKFSLTDSALYDELCRARQVVEAVFSEEKRHDNHVAAIGSAEERLAAGIGERDILFVSRVLEFWARAIRYNLCKTVIQEHLRSQRISHSAGTIFSRSRERLPDIPTTLNMAHRV